MKKMVILLLLGRGLFAQSASSACDVSHDGAVNIVDVQLSVNQALGLAPCTGDLNGDGICNVVDVQRVITAALGGACVSSVASGASTNAVTIFEVDGTTQANRPITLGRVFKQGEIPGCPQPVIGSQPIANYQADVKNRWGDGSVKFAVVSFTQTLSAGAATAVSFQNAASCNNSGALTQAQMVSFNSGNWGADIEVTAGGVTKVANAKTMLQNLTFQDCNLTYWLQGPVVTQVLAQDCTSSFSYDFGWHWDGSSMKVDAGTQYQSLHPIFILSFYPSSNNVKVDYVLENMWSAKWQDQQYSFVLKSGNPLTPVYSHGSFKHISATRWRKTFWSGMPAGHIRVDHNFPYLMATKALPNYDQAVSVNPTNDYSTFAAGDKGDIGGMGLDAVWGPGYSNNNEGAPLQREDLEYLYNMASCGVANSACAQAWYILTGEHGNVDSSLAANVSGAAGMWNNQGNVPYHVRESRAGGSFYCPGYADKDATPSSTCGAGAGSPTGRPVSRHAQPVGQYSDAILPVAPVGTTSLGGWSVTNCSHWLDYSYVPYLLTGDYYYLDEELQGASFCIYSVNSNFAVGGGGGFYGYINPLAAVIREFAWGMQTVARAAFIAVDGTPESSYYNAMVSSNIAVQEGMMGITGTSLTPSNTNASCSSYNATTANRWDWGRCTHASLCLSGACTPVSPALHRVVPGSCLSASNPMQGKISSATSTNPVVFTTTAPCTIGEGASISVWGATGVPWSVVNKAFWIHKLDTTHFSVPVSTLGFPPLSGSLSFSNFMLDATKATDDDEPWMYWMLVTALGHIEELGFTQVSSIATHTYQRLIEEVEDPTYNPYLVAEYVEPVKNGPGQCQGGSTTNPFFTSWGQVRAAFVPDRQTVATFDHNDSLSGNYPCTDHGYSLLARAAGAYVTKTNSGSFSGLAAWSWLGTHVPYFNNNPIGSSGCGVSNDQQIKYALAPR